MSRKSKLAIGKSWGFAPVAEGVTAALGTHVPTHISFKIGDKDYTFDLTRPRSEVIVGTLIALGARAQINRALAGIEDINEAHKAISDAFENIENGVFSERGGLREDAFAAILAAMTGKDKDSAETFINTKREKFTEMEFAEWVKAIRAQPQYKETARKLFPRKSGSGRKRKAGPSLSDLLS